MINRLKYLIIVISFFISFKTVHSDIFEILKFSGSVQISSDNKNWKKVDTPQKLNNGFWIKTGRDAKLTLLLPNRTQTIIGKNSTIQLNHEKKTSQTKVKLNMGKIWSKTNKKPVKIQIKTPNAVASIRGTEWVFDVSTNQKSSIAVMEGLVELANNSGNKKSVEKDQLASVDKSGNIKVNKLLNPGEYLQFVFRYEIEPFAYFPKSLFQTEKKYLEFVNKLINVKPDNKNCSLSNDISYKNLIQNIGNFSVECIKTINPENFNNAIFKDWLYLVKAEINFSQGNDIQGKKLINKVSSKQGKLYVESKYLFSLGEYKQAERKLNFLKVLKPKISRSSVYNLLGTISEAKGDNNKALSFYKSANNENKNWRSPYLSMAKIHLNLSNFDKALYLLDQAKNLSSSNNNFNAVKSQYFSYRNQIERAKKIGLNTLEVEPNNLELLVAQGIIELKAGNSENAIDYFSKATAIERNYAKAYSFMAVAHLHSGEIKQAITQLERAIKLDKLDPLPHIIASQIFSSELDAKSALYHAQMAIKKSKSSDTYAQLANDQQGGANVGRRYLEVGLPDFARKSSLKTKNIKWAGSSLFRASTANSDVEKNSNYIRGFTLDSQTFGSKRNVPDVISRPGENGYKEYRLGLGEKKSDFGYKFGKNGRLIDGEVEKSYLYDIGFFGVQSEPHHAPDNVDESYFALGFLGYGQRTDFDNNFFITANVIPFHTNSTYPVNDITLRVDAGHSMRTDSSTMIYTIATETGNADIKRKTSGNCTSKDKVKTSALEFGFGNLNQQSTIGDLSWSFDTALRTGESDYVVNGTSSTCSDLTSLIGGNYQNRDETLDNLEYDFLGTIQSDNIKINNNSGLISYRVRAGYYHHEFDQDIITDNISRKDFRSDRHKFFARPSLGFSYEKNKNSLNFAAISDYHPLRQAPILADDVAGISTHYEFMNPGAKIDQLSLKFSHAPDNNNLFTLTAETFEVENNPVYLLFREQWNADLLSNFTLNKFYNPNKDSLFKDHNDFAKAKFERISFAYEKVLGDDITFRTGMELWDANEKDHPKFDETSPLGSVDGIPERVGFTGITKISSDYTIATRIRRKENIYDKDNNLYKDKNMIELNYTAPAFFGDLILDLSGEIDHFNSLKTILMYRTYF